MANIFLDPNRWTDGSYTPPIFWNEEAAEYQFFGSNPASADVLFQIATTDVQAGDTLEFDYAVYLWQPPPGLGAFLNVVEGFDSSSTLFSVNLSSQNEGTVRITFDQDYSDIRILMGGSSSSHFADGFYLIDAVITPPLPPPPTYKVYELDKGWSFDGMYIPHFLEMNWYFGEDPFTDKTISKVRIHGLAKGRTKLSLAVAGMQTEYDGDYTEPQHIELPRNSEHISTEYVPTTNYVDSSNWGVSLQMKFEGRNIDLSQPEPAHVLQVLALQSSPQGNGKRIN
jgi:hypothetical protein